MIERTISRQMIIRIGEGNKAVFLMELAFVKAPSSPLSGPLESAADALTAREFDFHVGVGIGNIEYNFSFALLGELRPGIIPVERMVACHLLEPDTASHGIGACIS